MSELRKDMVRDNWVVIATGRALKPNDFPINKAGLTASGDSPFCPFCEGNEEYTTAELSAFRFNDSKPDTPGWSIRTIPNKYSALQLEGALSPVQEGIYESCNGLGHHEVIVEIPEHGIEFHEFTSERMEMVYKMLRERYQKISADTRIKYIQIYKNRGIFAGASLQHSHSQIMALPIVPKTNSGLSRYYQENGQCLLCNIAAEEKACKERIIYESDDFLVLCPYAPRFCYETWIIPKKHAEHFGDISDHELHDLAEVSKLIFTAMIDCLNDPSYNIIINSAPVNTEHQDGYHWFMEINPRLIVNAGVEVATGLYMNPVAPEISAQIFRDKIKNG